MLLHNILYCLVEVGFQIELEFHFEIALEKLEKEKNEFLSSFPASGLLAHFLLPARSFPRSPCSPLLPAWVEA